MNKPKPLKGKCNDIDHPIECQEGCVFLEEDIKSAVEWFKENVRLEPFQEKMLNKAFEDVVKENGKENID